MDKKIEKYQNEARDKIFQILKKAKKEDPSFFEIPNNPFTEEDTDSDDDEEKTEKWIYCLKVSSNPFAKEILKIRKELLKNVQNCFDEFGNYVPLSAINSTSTIFSSLYCRLLQLEHIGN